MEKLKPLDDVLTPDIRMAGFAAPRGLEAWHAQVAAISLSPCVPEDVRSYFGTIQNLMLFGWFSTDLCAVGGFLSLSAIELALKIKLPVTGQDRRTLGMLLSEASKRNLGSSLLGSRIEAIRMLRNENAHPRFRTIVPPGMAISMLQVTADIINELFRPAPEAPVGTP